MLTSDLFGYSQLLSNLLLFVLHFQFIRSGNMAKELWAEMAFSTVCWLLYRKLKILMQMERFSLPASRMSIHSYSFL